MYHNPLIHTASIAANICNASCSTITLHNSNKNQLLSSYSLNNDFLNASDLFIEKTFQEPEKFLIIDDIEKQLSTTKEIGKTIEPFNFYAGFTITGEDGEIVGCLSIMDKSAKYLDATQVKILKDLAASLYYQITLEQKNQLLTNQINELQKTNSLYEQTNLVAKIGYWELDLIKNTIYWSATTKSIHGVPQEYLPDLNTAINFFKEGEHRDKIIAAVNEAATLNLNYSEELIIMTYDGKEKWVNAKGSSEFVAGKCVRLYGTFQDINEYKLQQLIIEKSEKKYRSIIENSPTAFLLTKPDGSILDANKAALDMFGYSLQELSTIGRNGIVDTNDERLNKFIEERNNNKSAQAELNAFRKDGSIFPLVVSSSMFNDLDGETKTSLSMIDITQRKKMEEQLALSEQRFKAIFNSSFQIIGFLSTEGILLEINDTALNFTKQQPEEVIGKYLWDCYWWQISAQTQADLKVAIEEAGKGKSTQYEVEIWGENKTVFTILFNLKPLFDNNNNVIAIISEGRLIQDIANARKLLLQKNEELKEFASIASHDLKEPLRMIHIFMQMLQKNYGATLDERANKYIDTAVDGAQRMAILVNELLVYSQIGSDAAVKELIDTNVMVNEIISFKKTVFSDKEITFKIGKLPPIYGVKTVIKMLFKNLINNGIKYQQPNNNPVITISATEQKNVITFAITDNGIGIEEGMEIQIFQLFKRLHSRAEYAGTGMGLSTCKKIVELHGGEIWVESVENKGSTFYFTIKKLNINKL